jgi:peptide/nickel transport system permease protein
VRWYVVRRLIMLVPLTLLVTFVAFSLIHITPGGPVAALLGGKATTPGAIAAIKAKYHLDESFLLQYVRWLWGVLHLDFGRSILTGEGVGHAMAKRLEITLLLNFSGVAVAVLVGLPLGVIAAVRRGRALDRLVVSLGVLGISTPAFVSGVLLLYLFGLKLGWFPIFGAGSGVLDRAWHFVLPSITIGFSIMGLVLRITRASMLEQLDQDYVAFARARGLGTMRVTFGYALRNALIPVVTAAGLLLASMLSAGVLVETVYGLPGLGRLLVTSALGSDIPVIQGIVVVIAIWIVLWNILIDLIYVALDPRIAFERVAE